MKPEKTTHSLGPDGRAIFNIANAPQRLVFHTSAGSSIEFTVPPNTKIELVSKGDITEIDIHPVDTEPLHVVPAEKE